MKKKVLMTRYFYPIRKGGTKKFFNGIYFDNPRTQEEIDCVADILKKINYSTSDFLPEEIPNSLGFPYTIRKIIKNFCELNKTKKVVNDYSNNINETENVYICLAKMWVIVRSNQILDVSEGDQYLFKENEIEELFQKDRNYICNLLNFEIINKIMLFISFLVTEEYESVESILINDVHKIRVPHKSYDFINFMFGDYSLREILENPNLTFDHFSKAFNIHKKYIKLIGNKYNDEKFLFICEAIENIVDLKVKSPKMYLIGSIGIIEMLLTHNPDKSIYNIEDSINKQYVRKLKYVLYKNDKNVDLDNIENELKLSYSIRSDIAHGNFGKESKKNLEKLLQIYGMKKGGKGENYVALDYGIGHLNEKLTRYIRILLEMYLNDELELQLLKDL